MNIECLHLLILGQDAGGKKFCSHSLYLIYLFLFKLYVDDVKGKKTTDGTKVENSFKSILGITRSLL
jgi:hypothetical protein